jgi:serine/threonine-protein kinase
MAFFAAMTPLTDSTTQNALREAFDALLELPPEARVNWLETRIADANLRERLRQLLAAHDSRGFLDTTVGEHAARLAARDLAPEGLIGSRFGAFRLVRALGQGGMSAVFLGEREDADFRQQAAIKLLRRGLYSELEQRLFQRERRVLAALEHPHIARLIDGGVTAAGIPYLIMEYVDGLPITGYANTRSLDVHARVRLFVDVCRAVAEAHRNLIVHRDIKPSNILVAADGTVKLLDFGIAKLIEEDDTDSTGTIGVFTPDYAAPEQLRGGTITTATDVYGLGVLLHELLLGLKPGGTPTRRPSSRVNETVAGDVPRIERARLRKLLRGDLDNILLKALAEEPQRRYASAGALSDDIDNWLAGRAVVAHPPSRVYRARKFVQRHRGGVAVTVLFLAAVFAALGLALWQAQIARHEAARANTVRDFVIDLFDAARAHLPRNQRPTPETLVDQAQLRMSKADLDPLTHADLAQTLGEVELSMARFDRAQTLFDAAGRAAVAAGDTLALRHARVAHAQARQRAGDSAGALAELSTLMPTLRAAPDANLLRALTVQAAAEMTLGKPDAAIAGRHEAAAAASRLYGNNSETALAAQFEVGNTLADAQRYPEAIAALRPALSVWRARHGAEDDRYVAALGSLATAQDSVGDLPAAEARFRELLALKQGIYTAPHDAIAVTLRDLAQVVARAERYPEADSLIDQALAMDHAVFGGDNHLEIAEDYDARGGILVAQRRFAEADADYQKAIDICAASKIKDEVCARARNNLGMSLYRQNRLDEARQAMTQALTERRAVFGNDHPTVAYSLSTLANVAVKQGDYKTAVEDSSAALGTLERDGHGASREDALIRFGYAQALWMTNANADALREIERTLVDWQRVAPDAKARRVAMLVQKAQILADLKRPDDARRTALDAIAIGAPAAELAPQTKQLLRKLSGKSDAYPDSPQH